jgi:hypothetical protein
MNAEELVAVKEMHPTALTIWHDRMHDLNKGQLIETLLVHMSAGSLLETIGVIEADMAEEKEFDYDD